MSNKSEAAWHPNSGPATDHADLIGRLHKWCDRVVSPHAHTAMVEAADALANSVPREQYDDLFRTSAAGFAHYAGIERERDEAHAERDALAHVIERIRAAVGEKRRTEYSYEGISDDEIIDIDDFLPYIDAAPAVSLARHVAEVKAQALEEAAEVFATGEWSDAFAVGDVEDDVSAVQATAAWFKSRAAAIRAEAE